MRLYFLHCSANFLKLVVYYEDLNYEKIEETPEIEVSENKMRYTKRYV